MRERAINLRDWEVRAILAGRKTQTRRPVKPQPDGVRDRVVLPGSGSKWAERELSRGRFVTAQYEPDGSPLIGTAKGLHCHASRACPFGAPGDLLWVRECFALGRAFDKSRAAELPIIERDVPVWCRAHVTEDESWANRGKWRPSTQLPRWASRLTLRVADVRVERVQDITPEDAIAEGVFGEGRYAKEAGTPYPVATFAQLWRDAYGPESWTANPWVWVVSFDREVRR